MFRARITENISSEGTKLAPVNAIQAPAASSLTLALGAGKVVDRRDAASKFGCG